MGDFVKPEPVRLPLTGGHFIEIRKRLNHGETRAMHLRSMRDALPNDGGIPLQSEWMSKALAYLLDWNYTDDTGVVPIRGRSADDVAAALDALDEEDFQEIRKAIEAHETSMRKERDAQKKMAGMPTSKPISP